MLAFTTLAFIILAIAFAVAICLVLFLNLKQIVRVCFSSSWRVGVTLSLLSLLLGRLYAESGQIKALPIGGVIFDDFLEPLLMVALACFLLIGIPMFLFSKAVRKKK